MSRAVIFGGTGFIGTHMAQYLLAHTECDEIVLADERPPRIEGYTAALQAGLAQNRVRYIKHDVRRPADAASFGRPDVIYNLAAIHREPGHQAHEYYETNILGAEQVCDYATKTGCERIVFTSSISPYGPSEQVRHEGSLPVPETPYGGSKLVAEKIHLGWQQADERRRLLIVRPGVVFGPGEGGNVTRLVRSVVKGYFVYMGNRDTRKAGGYVKELCRVMQFGLDHQDRTGERYTLLNFSMDPPNTLNDFVTTIQSVSGRKRPILCMPRPALLGLAHVVDAVARPFSIRHPLSPVRVRKLFRSTNIEPRRLRELQYPYAYSLKAAFEDWKSDRPEDFR